MKKPILIGVGIFLIALILGILVFWGLTATGIITRGIQREVIQHSQPYVETKLNLLWSLYNDWTQLESEITETGDTAVIEAKRAQQAATVSQMRQEASMIPEGTVPPELREFINQGR